MDMTRALPLLLLAGACASPRERAPSLERVRVSPDGRGFVLERSGTPFIPWGFNYDRDDRHRLIEEFWEEEWPNVEEDFREMKELGANVVRVHLQFARFMKGPAEPDARALARLDRLLELAERLGLYLDLTGLASYRKRDVPPWYDRAAEKERWALQARFWEAVAARCARSPAVFCYNLMNEPVSPAAPQAEWLAGQLGGFHYVENLTRDPGGRSRGAVTHEWLAALVPAVRKHDPGRMITVGTFFVFENAGGLSLGTPAAELSRELDYLSVHLYPAKGKASGAIDLLKVLSAGKPVVIEEMFPLRCPMEEFRGFVRESRAHAAGWIGFYWGKSLEEYRRSVAPVDRLMAEWLDFFRAGPPR